MKSIRVIDSHTGGEPTRVVISGGPDFGAGTVAQQLETFRKLHDKFRSAVVNEPRGSDVLVGAMMVPPGDSSCAAGVLFFNNVGFLGMCGHGLIGVVTTLRYLGRLQAGPHSIETPVGRVVAQLHDDASVSVQNVPSYRKASNVTLHVEGVGAVRGDVAWGGNWFFLVQDPQWELELPQVEKLVDVCWRIRQAANAQGFPEVDHIELFGPPRVPGADSRNFVLCPGKAYDRSPCGTGTSAKMACLYAEGRLGAGQIWRQESITGSLFEGSVQEQHGHIIPTIRGTAFVISDAQLLLDPADPWCWGISPR
jgi:4-hydroxyproline epimerase